MERMTQRRGAVSPSFLVVLALLGLGCVAAWWSYDQLTDRRDAIEPAWTRVDALLEERYSPIPDLLTDWPDDEAVTLHEDVQAAHTLWRSAVVREAECFAANAMEDVLADVLLAAEENPALAQMNAFGAVRRAVADSETVLAQHRETYNRAVRLYNASVRRWPTYFVAQVLDYRQVYALLEVPPATVEADRLRFRESLRAED